MSQNFGLTDSRLTPAHGNHMDTLDTLNYGNTFFYFTEKEDSQEVSFQFKHFKYNVKLKEKVHSDMTLDRETHFVYSLQKLICTRGIPIKIPNPS